MAPVAPRPVIYRMPVHFGAMGGPRQAPDGRRFDWSGAERDVSSVTFVSDPARIAALLPPGFRVRNPATVTVDVQRLRKLPWLAGRGYNTLGVKFAAEYRSASGAVAGSFLAVLWENLADPIISGREELGFNKLYAEIPGPRYVGRSLVHEAGWLGHRFFEMRIDDLVPAPASAAPAPALPMLHYKYIPRTQDWGEADVAYATMTPVNHAASVHDRQSGTGSVRFLKSDWEELPTLFHIVNLLAGLPVLEVVAAGTVRMTGATDLGEQAILSAAAGEENAAAPNAAGGDARRIDRSTSRGIV